jgi:DNA-binding transcriptional regulator GbsR (MarR family)
MATRRSAPGTAPAPAKHTSLREAQDRFIAVWGQMAGAWGISRTMAEVHALLYITQESLCSDEIMERLQISRGNASMSLRSLLDWGIVSRINKRGDRKEYFRCEQDVWAMFRAIVRERLKREADPLLASLYEIRDLTARDRDPGARDHQRRIEAMVEFFETLEKLAERFVSPSGRGLEFAAKMLNKVPLSVLGGKAEKAAEPRA